MGLLALTVAVTVTATVSCSAILAPSGDPPGNGDDGDDTGEPLAPPTGSAAILFINKSSRLVQNLIAVEHEGLTPQIWATPVTPTSWDSLVFDCPFQRVRIIGTTPVDLITGEQGAEITFDGSPFTSGNQVACGSLIVVETSDNAEGGVDLNVRTLPELLADVPTQAARAPGADSGFILIRPEVPVGVTAIVRASWENDDGRRYATNWRVNGAERSVGALIECPALRIGWGSLADTTVAGATIEGDDNQTDIPAPPRLLVADGETGGQGTFQCGDAITFRVTGDGETQPFALETLADNSEAAVPPGAEDLFGRIREVIDAEGMAGQLSNSGMLLPDPTEPPAE